MKINVYHGKYNIVKRNTAVKYIVMHYVGSGSSSAGNALANCKYFAGGNRDASAHYFVDDSGIWEYADPKTYATWHCGDGGGKYGITNQNSIGVEVCINGDKPYTAKEIAYLKELVPYLMKKFNVPASRVVRHFDASRKQCPYYYVRRPAEWEKLKKIITSTTSSPTTTKPATTTVTPKSANVKTGQKGLNRILSGVKGFKSIVVNGRRDSATRKAEIMAVQRGLNVDYHCYLDVDGSFGPKSKKVMSAHYAKKGMKGEFVKAIQASLYCHGYSPKGIDGTFGPGMDAAVRAFQKNNGLAADGSVGPATVGALLK